MVINNSFKDYKDSKTNVLVKRFKVPEIEVLFLKFYI